MRKWIVGAAVGGLLLMAASAGMVLASSSASDLPPNWHIHDGQFGLGPQHKGIAFFPQILGISTAQYLQDPARCPNATDKALLPSNGDGAVLRAGVCMTGALVIQLRTVPAGTAGPAGWSSIVWPSEPDNVTYYLITPK
jgi:hypothetical protein